MRLSTIALTLLGAAAVLVYWAKDLGVILRGLRVIVFGATAATIAIVAVAACDLPILHPEHPDPATISCGQYPVTEGCAPGYCCPEGTACKAGGICEDGETDAPGAARAPAPKRQPQRKAGP